MTITRTILVLLLAVLLWGCKEELYSGLRENEVNEMVSILLREGISSEKKKDLKSGTYSVLVDGAQFHIALELLKRSGYPKEKFLRVNELFKNEGLVSSPLEERVRYIYAIAQDVQETLSRIDGVVTARVHIVLPENDPFVEKVKPSSASVFIKYLPDRHLDDIKAQIKLIVEKSIEGLSYDKVSVVLLPADDAAASNKPSVTWVDQWGVRVDATSVGRLRLLVWSLVATIGVLILALLILIRQPRTHGTSVSGEVMDGQGEAAAGAAERTLANRILDFFRPGARHG